MSQETRPDDYKERDIVTPQRTPGSSEHSPTDSQARSEAPKKRAMTLAERDAALLNSLKEHEGSLANAEFEDGQVSEGYRRNVKANIFRYI
ncbi:hypothetical protein VTO73DRAFT_13192 [Trametes versicolor]